MSRSIKKGPYVEAALLKKVEALNAANKKQVIKDDCGEYQIPHNIIKFSIHKEKEKSNIQVLSNLVNGEVLERVIKAGQKEEYTMRFWIANNTLPTGSKLHYHGKIVVTDEGTQVATTIS